MRSLIIDNFDSFTHNIYQLLAQVNQESPTVITNNQWSWEQIQAENFDNIIISPGPGNPSKKSDFGVCGEVLVKANIPILGICLGHQGLGYFYGSKIVNAPIPMHGRISKIYHNNDLLFQNIPSGFEVVRYHSLMIDDLGEDIEAIAHTDDNIIMAIRHKIRPFWGVQFHPESICSQHGFELLNNFKKITKFNYNYSTKKKFKQLVNYYKKVKVNNNKYQVYSCLIKGWREPELIFKQFYNKSTNSFWLDSSMVAEGLSRFSFMGDTNNDDSFTIQYTVDDNKVYTQNNQGEITTLNNIDFYGYLNDIIAKYACEDDRLPFNLCGGLIGYFGYELKQLSGYNNKHKSPLPDCYLIKGDRLLAFDHKEKKIYLIYIGTKEAEKKAQEWFKNIENKISQISVKNQAKSQNNKITKEKLNLTRNQQQYLHNIDTCFQKIKQGESYEICLTNQINLPPIENPLEYYCQLRKQNPTPYSAFIKFHDITIICSSPERFLHLDKQGWLESKPIKGTVRRGINPQEDTQLLQQLSLSEKEKAENLMIVDLLRNDLGKICQIGSIHVPKLMAIESYSTVHQMVSTVRGKLKQDITPLDCLKYIFPGGSMTGAPKKRTLEIIDELETEARGIYSGSIGFLSFNGTLDLNIVIRTAIVTKNKTTIGVGGAITALSDKNQEFEEIILKAQALLTALQ
ncbi:aminodeoxychorismate synthase [Cyanobacterium stanieri LEGE 03274]|uniref:aminodeoxychorismate synthase n=1 Tax=Cyanobacterium stanieri LEGE 03274 TaxID=1828756 RepID=A0ABR9V3H6_9CHRO|nr:aminodeoxychorismate synthase [Cyanobacterium stanieri]MBE9222447.1 aminodeoxychorismate synthase [Cyanobacterium stanieri LEGE 03274]